MTSPLGNLSAQSDRIESNHAQSGHCRSVSGVFPGDGGVPLFFQGWLPCGVLKGLVLMVHGLGSHGGTFWPWARSLVNQRYGIYALDIRGHGRSQGKQGFIESWAVFRQDLHLFVQRIQQNHQPCPYILFGHSLGGAIVLDYVLSDAVKADGVIVMAPALSQGAVPPWKRWIAQTLSQVWPDFTLANGFQSDWGTRDPLMAMLMDQDMLRHPWGSARLGTEYFQTVRKIMKLAPRLKIPTLVLHGSEDLIVDERASGIFFNRLRLKDKTRLIYPKGRHDLHLDLDRDRVVADVGRWISNRVKLVSSLSQRKRQESIVYSSER